METPVAEFARANLDFLLLALLGQGGPTTGAALAERLAAEGAPVPQRSVYTALTRLGERGLATRDQDSARGAYTIAETGTQHLDGLRQAPSALVELLGLVPKGDAGTVAQCGQVAGIRLEHDPHARTWRIEIMGLAPRCPVEGGCGVHRIVQLTQRVFAGAAGP